jgi:hypothetical protein
MNRKKYKEILQNCLKILEPGERHKWFTYAIFENLPKEYQVNITTSLEKNEIRTAFCYAGDIARGFLEFYYASKIDWDKQQIMLQSIEDGPSQTFYLDAVAIAPAEIIHKDLKIKLIHDHKIIELDKIKRKIKRSTREKNTEMIEKLAEEARKREEIKLKEAENARIT